MVSAQERAELLEAGFTEEEIPKLEELRREIARKPRTFGGGAAGQPSVVQTGRIAKGGGPVFRAGTEQELLTQRVEKAIQKVQAKDLTAGEIVKESRRIGKQFGLTEESLASVQRSIAERTIGLRPEQRIFGERAVEERIPTPTEVRRGVITEAKPPETFLGRVSLAAAKAEELGRVAGIRGKPFEEVALRTGAFALGAVKGVTFVVTKPKEFVKGTIQLVTRFPEAEFEIAREFAARPAGVAGEFFGVGRVFKVGGRAIKTGKLKAKEIKFEAGIRQFEADIPKIPSKELKIRLETGGIKTREPGVVQTTFGISPEVISADTAARIRIAAKVEAKAPLRRPTPPSRIAAIETIEPGTRIITLEKPGEKVTALGKFPREFETVRRRLFDIESAVFREPGIQKTLVPKAKVKQKPFRIIKEPRKVIFKDKTKEFKPFEGEPAKTLSVGDIQLIQARKKLLFIPPPEEVFARIPPPRGAVEITARPALRVAAPPGLLFLPGVTPKERAETRPDIAVKITPDVIAFPISKPDVRALPAQAIKPILEVKPTPALDVRPTARDIVIVDVVPTTTEVPETILPLPPPRPTPPPRRPAPTEPRPLREAPLLVPLPLPKKKAPIMKGKFEGYKVTARQRGRDIKLNKVPLTKQAAESLGAYVVDNTVSARYKVSKIKRKLSEPPKKTSIAPSGYAPSTASKFRGHRTDKFGNPTTSLPMGEKIERRAARIDTMGEKQELSVARFLAQKRKKKKTILGF